MNANTRIQWLHKKLTLNSYPNAHRIMERFGISHRQAQRDLDFLRKSLGAPIAYDAAKKGFYYSASFSLPLLLSSDNDDVYMPEIFDAETSELAAEESIIQMQIPFSATVDIPDRLTALELDRYIVSRAAKNRYVCEFHSVEKFLGLLLSLDSDFCVVEPLWLKERLIKCAQRVLNNNGHAENETDSK